MSMYLAAVERPQGFNGATVVMHLVQADDVTVDAVWSDAGMCGSFTVPASNAAHMILEGESAAVRAWVRAYVADVIANPDAYKASVRAAPALQAWVVVNGLDDVEVRRMLADLRAEQRAVRAHGGTP